MLNTKVLSAEKKDGKARGSVEFKDVSLRYGYAPRQLSLHGLTMALSADAPRVVKNVSFSVEAGRKVAMVGRSGLVAIGILDPA